MTVDLAAAQRRLRSASFLASFDRFTIPPLLVPIGLAFGVPLGTAALAASAYFITYGLMQPFWGGLSDRLLAVTLAMALVLTGLTTFRVLHIPAVATALLVSLGLLHKPDDWLALIVAILICLAVALALARARGVPMPLWSRAQAPRMAASEGD